MTDGALIAPYAVSVLHVVFCKVADPVEDKLVQVVACKIVLPETLRDVAVKLVQVVIKRFVTPVTVRLKRDDKPVTVILKNVPKFRNCDICKSNYRCQNCQNSCDCYIC